MMPITEPRCNLKFEVTIRTVEPSKTAHNPAAGGMILTTQGKET